MHLINDHLGIVSNCIDHSPLNSAFITAIVTSGCDPIQVALAREP